MIDYLCYVKKQYSKEKEYEKFLVGLTTHYKSSMLTYLFNSKALFSSFCSYIGLFIMVQIKQMSVTLIYEEGKTNKLCQ